MNRLRPKDKTITELVMTVIDINDNMNHIMDHSVTGEYSRASHYVGMNYDLHIKELRERGYNHIADKYDELGKRWRQ